MMKAIRVHENGEPEAMKIEDVPDPKPEAGQVVAKIRAAGVNPVDTYIRGGLQGYARPLPWTPGIDAAGVVESIGPEVTRIKPGDRVYCAGTLTGAYAEKALCTAAQVHPLPERISFAQGACVNVPYATAWRALFQRARAQAGESVLVHGASGGVGVAAVQIARAAGMTVIGTSGTSKGRELVMQQGAHHVLDHNDAGHLDRAAELAGGGLNVILEMLANVNLGRDLPALAMGGRVVVIGSRGTVEINPRDTMARESSIMGMVILLASESELKSIHAGLAAGLENGTLCPIVGRELPLAEAPAAHHAIMEQSAYGNMVLVNPD